MHRFSAALLLSLLAACGGGAGEDAPHASARRQAITDGYGTSLHPEVGMLLGGRGDCTATLIGPRTVLTAAHCISPGFQLFFHREAEVLAVDRLVFHPGFGPMSNDVALLHLARVSAAAPALIARSAPHDGSKVTFVGYGVTGEQVRDYGEKRMATNTLNGKVTETTFSVRGSGGDTGNVCYGDSGGPVFSVLEGVERLIGTVSYGEGPCGTEATFMRVDAFAGWIDEEGGGDVLPEPVEAASVSLRALDEVRPGEPFTLAAEVATAGGAGNVSVFFYADCEPLGEVQRAPYALSATLEAGSHTVAAVARVEGGPTSEATRDLGVHAAEGCAAAAGPPSMWVAALLALLRRRRPPRLVGVAAVAAGLALLLSVGRVGARPPPAPVPASCQAAPEMDLQPGLCRRTTAQQCRTEADCDLEAPCVNGRCAACRTDADCMTTDRMGMPVARGTGLCDVSSGQCKACQTEGPCRLTRAPSGRSYLACGSQGVCLECNSDEDCAFSQFKRCDASSHTCSRCTDDSQCCVGTDCGARCDAATGACTCATDQQCAAAGGACVLP